MAQSLFYCCIGAQEWLDLDIFTVTPTWAIILDEKALSVHAYGRNRDPNTL